MINAPFLPPPLHSPFSTYMSAHKNRFARNHFVGRVSYRFIFSSVVVVGEHFCFEPKTSRAFHVIVSFAKNENPPLVSCGGAKVKLVTQQQHQRRLLVSSVRAETAQWCEIVRCRSGMKDANYKQHTSCHVSHIIGEHMFRFFFLVLFSQVWRQWSAIERKIDENNE